MAVGLTTGPVFEAAPPKLLFRPPPDAGALLSISRDGRRFAFSAPKPPERKVISVTPEILLRYTGTYEGPEEDTAIVSVEGTQLMVQHTGPSKRTLLAESEIYFFFRQDQGDRDYEFVADRTGLVTHFVRHSRGFSGKYTRK